MRLAPQNFPGSIIEAHGRPALEAIEVMSGRKVPGQAWRKITQAGGSRVEERISLLMEQYRQMLRFLGVKGCLLNYLRPEVNPALQTVNGPSSADA